MIRACSLYGMNLVLASLINEVIPRLQPMASNLHIPTAVL
jgi:hypothetical protein